jgi:hypothetical protein
MRVTKEHHIAYKMLTCLLVVALLAPPTVKLIHVFEHHQHEVCIGGNTTHIHKVDLDCEFQKFQLNNHFLTPQEDNGWFHIWNHHKPLILTYKFLNNHRQLSFSLRGPPVLV